MKYELLTAAAALVGASAARQLHDTPVSFVKRQVPQELSHKIIVTNATNALKLNNPDDITDGVFALLGHDAAIKGAGKISDTDCLQQAVADQAFTNAKAANDITGMSAAIMFRALERNTGKVGLASNNCVSLGKANNPEIAAIQQHQDAASSGAAALNKAVEIAVAQQLASIGGDPNQALLTATFPPGDVNDPTAKGNTCDVQDDATGCGISQKLIVPEIDENDIAAAVAGISGGAGGAAAAASDDSGAAGNAADAAGDAADAAASDSADAAPAATSAAAAGAANANAVSGAKAASGANVQKFTGTLGGAAPPVVSTAGSNRPFSVDGSTFVNVGAALQRSCSVQHNQCANAANSGSLAGGVGQCETQEQQCNAQAGAGKRRSLRPLRT